MPIVLGCREFQDSAGRERSHIIHLTSCAGGRLFYLHVASRYAAANAGFPLREPGTEVNPYPSPSTVFRRKESCYGQ